MEDIKNMIKKELERKINAYEGMMKGPHNSRDVIYLDLLYTEAEKRGYEIKTAIRVRLIS